MPLETLEPLLDESPDKLDLDKNYAQGQKLADDEFFSQRVEQIHELKPERNRSEEVRDKVVELYTQIVDQIIHEHEKEFSDGKVFINLIVPRKLQVASILPTFLNKCFEKLHAPDVDAQDNFIHAVAEIFINYFEHNQDDDFNLMLLLTENEAQAVVGPSGVIGKKETKSDLAEDAKKTMNDDLENLDTRHRGTPIAVLMPDEVERVNNSWLITQHFPARSNPEEEMMKYFGIEPY